MSGHETIAMLHSPSARVKMSQVCCAGAVIQASPVSHDGRNAKNELYWYIVRPSHQITGRLEDPTEFIAHAPQHLMAGVVHRTDRHSQLGGNFARW